MKQFEYKQYQFLVHKARDWTCSIRRPNAKEVMTIYPHATLDEGLKTLLERVKAVIDEDIARSGRN